MWFDTAPSTFDPYAQDRQAHMDMLRAAQSDFSASQQAPLGFLDPEMQRFLESKTREDVRSANPKAGGSGWLQDREATEMLKLRLGLLDKNLKESNNQRNYMAQLAGIQQPTRHVSGQTGIFSQAGSQMLGKASEGLGHGFGVGVGDWVGKNAGDWVTNLFGGRRAPQNPNTPGQSTYVPGLYAASPNYGQAENY